MAKSKKYESKNTLVVLAIGVPRGIRTPDPLIRSQILYPAELWAQIIHYKKK